MFGWFKKSERGVRDSTIDYESIDEGSTPSASTFLCDMVAENRNVQPYERMIIKNDCDYYYEMASLSDSVRNMIGALRQRGLDTDYINNCSLSLVAKNGCPLVTIIPGIPIVYEPETQSYI